MFNHLWNTFKLSGLIAFLFLGVFVPHSALAAQNSFTHSGSGQGSAFPSATTGRGYHFLGTAQGQGDIFNSMVGPGASSNQMFYLTYTYTSGTMDFVAIDPNSGSVHVYPSPVQSEQGAWALTLGPDNNMYIGTLPNAHLLEFNTSSQQLTDLGQVPPDPASSTPQSFIWQLTVSSHNHLLYGCTYPSADLVSYNPLDASPRIVNLGTMDPTHQDVYTRACTADPSPNAPYIYLGLGSVSDQLIAYNTDTKTETFRINDATASFGRTYLASDGNVHGWLLNGSTYQYYTLSNGGYTSSSYVGSAPTNVLHDGSTIALSASTITITHPDKSTTNYPYTYGGKGLKVDRIGLGPDGLIYGGTELPYNLFTFDPNHPTTRVVMRGQIGQGEPYSLLASGKLLYVAAYSPPNLLAYDPSKPFDSTTNPTIISSGNVQADLRAVAMIGAPNNTIYMGSYGSYGKLTGPLLIWNTLSNAVQQFFPIQNQGVVSLARTKGACQDNGGSSCLIGGTTIFGGGGTTPTTTSAQLFSWNLANNTVIHQYTIPNIGNPNTITDLVTNPANGYVYGIATNIAGSYVFVFNPSTGKFIDAGHVLPFSDPIYNSVTLYKGKIWGISSQGVFSIKLSNVSQATLIRSSNTITVGFVMHSNVLYFASNTSLWSYTIG